MNSKLRMAIIALIAALAFTACHDNGGSHEDGGEGGSFSGSLSYEGQTYKTVKIGGQIWMAKNLNYAADGSVCYENEDSNCDDCGKLYDWATAMALPESCNSSTCASSVSAKHKGICPSGWHIPSDDEFTALENYVGPSAACSILKAETGWSNNRNGTDDYGFSALPCGGRAGGFNWLGTSAIFWSATESNGNYAWRMYLDAASAKVVRSSNHSKSSLFSVRCVQD